METEAYLPLPFFFRRIDADTKMLLTNQAGSFTVLDSTSTLEDIVSGKLDGLSPKSRNELIAKNFVRSTSRN